LRDAITNLIFNAVDAMPQGGTLTLRTRAEGEAVLLEVVDTGLGMTEEVRRNCFEPFFTTKSERGTGLGLVMASEVAQHHSGTLDVASEPGKGTTFTLRLPVGTKPATG
jgi:signal transduction histidine kinase